MNKAMFVKNCFIVLGHIRLYVEKYNYKCDKFLIGGVKAALALWFSNFSELQNYLEGLLNL